MNNKIQQNKNLINRNYGELMMLKEKNLHSMSIKNGMQQTRKERKHDRKQVELINEKLSVVKNKIQHSMDEEDVDAKENKNERSMTLRTNKIWRVNHRQGKAESFIRNLR